MHETLRKTLSTFQEFENHLESFKDCLLLRCKLNDPDGPAFTVYYQGGGQKLLEGENKLGI